MTLKETIAEELQNLIEELEEDEDEMTTEEVISLVKKRLEEVISLVNDD